LHEGKSRGSRSDHLPGHHGKRRIPTFYDYDKRSWGSRRVMEDARRSFNGEDLRGFVIDSLVKSYFSNICPPRSQKSDPLLQTDGGAAGNKPCPGIVLGGCILKIIRVRGRPFSVR
jgi:hypothetical protein